MMSVRRGTVSCNQCAIDNIKLALVYRKMIDKLIFVYCMVKVISARDQNDIKIMANKRDVPYQSFIKMILAKTVQEEMGQKQAFV